jgi:O-antigen/teichoic acid export membrane protein
LSGGGAAVRRVSPSFPRPRLPGGVWRYYGGFAIGRISGLIVIPVASRVLGPSGFGRFEAAFALFLAATIVLDAGLGATLVRFVGEEKRDTSALLRAAGRVQVFASLGAVVIIGVPLFLFDLPDRHHFVTGFALVMYAYNEGFAVIGGGLLRATGRDGMYAVLSFVRLIVTAGAAVIGALALGPSGALLGVAFGGIGFSSLALLNIARAHRAQGANELGTMLRYGMPLMATTIMSWTLSVSDRLFLRGNVSAATLGAYSANYRLGNLVLVFVAGPIGLTWIQAARRAHGGVELDHLRRRWGLAYTLVALWGVTLLVGLGPLLVPIVFGSGFHFHRTIVAEVALSGWFGGAFYLIATPALMREQTRRLVPISLVVAGFNLLANAILIPRYGADGAAAATCISYGFMCLAALFSAPVREQRWLFHSATVGVIICAFLVAGISDYSAAGAVVLAMLLSLAVAASLWRWLRAAYRR